MIDLDHLEKYTENNRIEAKKALGGLPHSIWETYSAFANALGGIILLGVEEYKDKTLHTVDLPDPDSLVREFWDKVNDPNKASVNLLTKQHIRIEKVSGDRIIVIEVPRAPRYQKPVYIDGNAASGTYFRCGEGDHHCTAEELQAMYRDADFRTQDMRVLEQTDCAVFCAESIRSYRDRMKRSRPAHVWESLDDSAFLLKLGAAGTGTDGEVHPTAAGLLMFGREQEILREYPDYSLEYREACGDMQQETESFASSAGDWSGNVFDFYFHVCGRLQAGLNETPETDDTPVQKAIREGLANCLVNADYYGSGGVVIVKQPDLITMSNPGAFRVGLDEARAGGMSDPRNGILMKMFHLLDIGERAGSGIPSILYTWKQQGWSEPVVSQSFAPNRIMLSLPLTKSSGQKARIRCADKKVPLKTETRKEMVIAYLTEHVTATCAELCELLDLKPPRVRKIMRELTEEGIVTAPAGNRNLVYKLKA
ncbi:MAG: putative DNA binding domain-containing protein [Oscillospiraceae bacterium]|nr:putative DNA binding domain-containing protein [Oscillospiraceae bacterium]